MNIKIPDLRQITAQKISQHMETLSGTSWLEDMEKSIADEPFKTLKTNRNKRMKTADLDERRKNINS